MGRVMCATGRVLRYRGVFDEAKKLLRAALELQEELGDAVEAANTLHELGVLQRLNKELDEAQVTSWAGPGWASRLALLTTRALNC